MKLDNKKLFREAIIKFILGIILLQFNHCIGSFLLAYPIIIAMRIKDEEEFLEK